LCRENQFLDGCPAFLSPATKVLFLIELRMAMAFWE
jgi:hypothetical protein